MIKNIKSEAIINRLDAIIKNGYELLSTIEPRYEDDKSKKKGIAKGEYADEVQHLKFTVSGLFFIESTVGENSIFYREFNNIIGGIAESPIMKQIVILESLKTELTDIWYWSAQGLANAEVFSNMLEESTHLLEKGFLIPAAILAGCVLETHLRKLSEKNAVEITTRKSDGNDVAKKAAILNHELAKLNVIHKNDSSAIESYLKIRNSAAHGKLDELTPDHVKIMQLGIAGIIGRTPL